MSAIGGGLDPAVRGQQLVSSIWGQQGGTRPNGAKGRVFSLTFHMIIAQYIWIIFHQCIVPELDKPINPVEWMQSLREFDALESVTWQHLVFKRNADGEIAELPRVVIGSKDYEELLSESNVVLDRTGFATELLEVGTPRHNLVLFARRSGKTIVLKIVKMLCEPLVNQQTGELIEV